MIHRLHSAAMHLCIGLGLLSASATVAAGELAWQVDPAVAGVVAPTRAPDGEATDAPTFSPREMLTAVAQRLLDIRYRRGGREPSTGFDCSGFVRYVFMHGLNAELPASSAAQFLDGLKVDRDELQEGDLVFFRTAGKRISHVGIYLGDGSFIHAPSTGKRVSVSRLAETYWAKRFAGAKRPAVLATVDAATADDRG